MSASSTYRPPEPTIARIRWRGRERRAQDPVNRLGRALDGVCRDASDPFEIAAHLEALGYDGERVAVEFGAPDTFTLARELYGRVPRRRPIPRGRTVRDADPLRWVLMVAALLFTAGLGAVTEGYARPAVLWLLVWSQMGAVLLQRGRAGLPVGVVGGLAPLVALAGALGMAGSYLIVPFGAATALISLTWLGVALSLWSGRAAAGLAVVLLVAVAAGAGAVAGAGMLWAVVAAAVLPIIMLRSLRHGVDARILLPWVGRQASALAFPAAYGLGQGLLLLRLVQRADPYALAGLVLFAGLLLVSEPALHALLGRMRNALWTGDAAAGYAAGVRRMVLAYAGLYLALPGVLAALRAAGWGGPWVTELLAFALFGASLALALVPLALGQLRSPALLFLGAGALAVAGLPVLPLLAILSLSVLAGALLLTREVPRYAVHLL